MTDDPVVSLYESPWTRVIIWLAATVGTALVVIVSPLIFGDDSEISTARSLGSNEVLITGLVIMVAGNGDLLDADLGAHRKLPRALIVIGSLLVGMMSLPLYARIADLNGHTPDGGVVTGVLFLFSYAVASGTNAVFLAANG